MIKSAEEPAGPRRARAGGLAGVGAGLMLAFAAAAEAMTPAPTPAPLAPLDRLIAQDEIRQKLTLYTLYADGAGPGGAGRDLRKLADTLMTPDVVSEIHPARGGPPRLIVGREVIARTPPEVDPERAAHVGGRHYIVSTVFDDIDAAMAHTRSTAVYFDASRNLRADPCPKPNGPDCPGRPIKTVMWVYEMTWVKTAQGWMISRNILRDDN